MKKFYAILIIMFALVALQTKAQNICSAGFTTQFLTGSMVKFNPYVTDSPAVQHTWSFYQTNGNYNNVSFSVSPSLNFPTGIFLVRHAIVRLSPNGIFCIDSSFQTITITQGCILNAFYNGNHNLSSNPTHSYYNFTNYLSATDSIRWTYGDGSSSSAYDGLHTFLNPGVYNVCLRLIKRNTDGTLSNCISEYCRLDTITLPPVCNIQAYFSNSADSVVSPATIQFNNLTVNFNPTDSITWNFGDGSAVSHTVNPNHIYTASGTYTVCLRVKRNSTSPSTPPCISEYCKQITITSPACTLLANFTWYRDSIVTIPYSYHFTNTSAPLSSSDSIRWTFGDGTTSNQLNPVHNYTTPGTYNVCLRIIKRNASGALTNCISEKCYNVIVTSTINTCNIQAYFTNISDSLQQNIVHFTNQSPGYLSTDSIYWNFGDGSPIVCCVSNPNHTYTLSGTYTVCIRIVRHTVPGTAPCIREYCKVITVTTPCNLLVTYSYYKDSSVTPAVYHFTNTTATLAATDSIRWTFGDGTSSNQINPTHSYAQPGSYMACLRVQRRNANGTLSSCFGEVCYLIVVTNPTTTPCNIQAYFSSIANTSQPNTINFTNQSPGYLPTDSVFWNFGDGSPIVTGVNNPTHTYTAAGSYNVCIKIKRNTIAGTTPCIREYCKIVTITIPCNLVANFTWYRDSLPTIALNTYHFTNTSAPLSSSDSIRWTFGDGTSSNQVNPIHAYAQPGTYTVCLRVQKRNPNGVLQNCVSEKCYTIVVPIICTLQSNYTWAATTANYKTIVFTNTTVAPATGATAIWSFGDGTSATTWNATHTYAQAGRYAVCLRTQLGTCISYKCDSITVVAPQPACSQLSLYSYVSAASNNNIKLFSPNYVSADIQYTWTFGDGTGAQGANATHQFTNPGFYTVCLTAFKNNNCASTTCNSVYIAPSCNNYTLGYNDVRDSLMPNRVRFVATSNATITNQIWTITKVPTTAGTGTATIQANNPTYVFLDSGYYNVCIRATYSNGCVKEYCRVIHIASSIPATNNCSLQLFPNPASSIVNANISLAQPLLLNAFVYNTLNMLVAQKQQQGVVGNNTVSINIAALPAGIYTLRLLYGGQVCTATFIKQ